MADDIIQQIEIQGGDEVASAFNAIGNAGAAAFSQIASAAAAGDFTGLADLIGGDLAASFAKAAQSVLEFVEGEAKAMETATSLSEALGTTFTEFESLEGAAASSGISVQGFDRAMGRLAQTVTQTWSSIQQSVRTSGMDAEKAQLGLEEATNNVTKAYQAMDKAVDDAMQHAEHAATDQQSAQLNLQKAMLSQQKDLGVDTGPQEKILQQQQDALNVEKAKMAIADLNRKQIQEQIADDQKLVDAEENIKKAQLAQQEAAEKAHEAELKDLPKIAGEINEVAAGYKKWGDIANVGEISAENLRKSLILAASQGGQMPTGEQVLQKMMDLFPKMGQSADAMNAKLEITQRLLASGFRSGQGSVTQWIRMLDEGKERVESFRSSLESLQKTNLAFTAKKMPGVPDDSDQSKLEKFEGAWAELGAILQNIAGHFAAVIASGITPWIEALTRSLTESGGVMNMVAQVAQMFIQGLLAIGNAVGLIISTFVEFGNIVMRAFNIDPIVGWAAAIAGLVAVFFPVTAAIAAIIVLIGLVVSHWNDIKAGAEAAWNAVNGYIDAVVAKISGLISVITGPLFAAFAVIKQAFSGLFGGGGGQAASATGGGAATGGLIRGPGGPTDDKAGLWALSDGEYVIRAAAVQHYGSSLFEALNAIAVGGFATGGMVGHRSIAAISPANPGGPTSIVNLHLDGHDFNGLRAPENVAVKLKQYAVTRQSSATGRNPSWIR